MNDEREKLKKMIEEQEKAKIENSPEAKKGRKLACQQIELTKYRNERNLMLYPFCSTSKRKRLKTIEYKSSDGKQWLQVTANHEFGMAKIWDFDIIRFALSKAGEIKKNVGYFPKFVEFSTYECLKAIGRDPRSGKNNEWLESALARLVSTAYRGTIFRDDANLVAGFTLINFEYIKNDNDEVDKVKIIFNERLIESAGYGNGLLAISNEVINEESGIKKRLLELVKVSKGESIEWLVKLSRLKEMCAHEGELKKFKSLLKSYSLPWKVSFSKAIDGDDKVTFQNP